MLVNSRLLAVNLQNEVFGTLIFGKKFITYFQIYYEDVIIN